jgi:2,4-dichlorophenol 6-monooxygenase
LAEHGEIPIDAIRIGHVDGDRFDPRCTWLRHRGVETDGAVLVRPDRFVAWRTPTMCDDPLLELTQVFETILGRDVAASVPPHAMAAP